jgi:hypothetical protein
MIEHLETFVQDYDVLEQRIFRSEPDTADLRIVVSTILRRHLVEQEIHSVNLHLKLAISILATDLRPIATANKLAPLSYFQAAGAEVYGLQWAALSANPGSRPRDFVGFSPSNLTELKTHQFLQQAVIYFEGKHCTRADIVKFVANKVGGAHFDHRREDEFKLLDAARDMVLIGIDENDAAVLSFTPTGGTRASLSRRLRVSLDPVFLELLSTAQFYVKSPSIKQLRDAAHAVAKGGA